MQVLLDQNVPAFSQPFPPTFAAEAHNLVDREHRL